MRRTRRFPLALPLLALLALGACSSEPLVEIGDPEGAPAEAIPAGRVITNAVGYMDGERAKVEAELTNKRGEENGQLRVFVLGPGGEIEMLVDERWRAQVESIQPGDDFIAYVTLGTAGQEPFLRTVLIVR